MINEKYIELINKEIDGTITPFELNELKEYLQDNPDGMKYYNDLKDSLGMLNKIPDSDPPENLKKTIMNSIDRNKYVNKSVQKKLIFSRRQYLRPSFAVVLALGIIAGLIMYPVLFISQNGALEKDIRGTIGLVDEISEISKNEFKAEGANGIVKLFQNRKRFWFDVEIFSQQDFTFNLSYDKTKFIFTSLEVPDSTGIFIRREADRIIVNGGKHKIFKLYFIQIVSVPSEFRIRLLVKEHEEFSRLIKVK